MAIDVLNHMWVGVFSASYVAQHSERVKAEGGDCSKAYELAGLFAEEAAAVADRALEVYRDNCAREAAGRK